MDCSTPGLPVPHHLPKFAQVHVHCITDGIQPSHPLTPSSPSSSSSSSSSSDTLFSFCPESNVYSESISPKIDWFDLLAVQETLGSLLWHHNSKASILWCFAFFVVQLSQLYMTTGKTIALTTRTFVGRGMSLLFNCLGLS